MEGLIDLGTEVLLDESGLRDPHLRLLLAAIGTRLLPGSAWVAVDRDALAFWLEPLPTNDSLGDTRAAHFHERAVHCRAAPARRRVRERRLV